MLEIYHARAAGYQMLTSACSPYAPHRLRSCQGLCHTPAAAPDLAHAAGDRAHAPDALETWGRTPPRPGSGSSIDSGGSFQLAHHGQILRFRGFIRKCPLDVWAGPRRAWKRSQSGQGVLLTALGELTSRTGDALEPQQGGSDSDDYGAVTKKVGFTSAHLTLNG